ncbi:hypothetical protein ACMA1D_10670 [Streptomyces sp. 796.1]|uniref:hypothetical protein n=1 Tax=Streptomyces sp. 796.1 TaxID=3163029 RepID=UPI0039C91C50
MKDMLSSVSSRELAEWMAYEKVAGPVGSVHGDEILAAIHEQLGFIAHLLGAAHFSDESHPNPIPAPERYPRPHELALRAPSKKRNRDSGEVEEE